MNSFFALAALAATAAADIDFEDILSGEVAVKELIDWEELSHEMERERKQVMEDAECWWADRNNGDGVCAKRTRDEAMQACWGTEGMTWDWDAEECITWEEEQARRVSRCVKQGFSWDEERCGCNTGEPWMKCEWDNSRFWSWSTNQCFDTWDQVEAADAQHWKSQCEEDGYEFRQEEGQTWGMCMDPQTVCWNDMNGNWDWETQTCKLNDDSNMKGLVMAKRLQETSKVDFVIDLNLPQLMDITEDAREGHEEAEELFNDLAADTKDFVADWAGELLEWQTDQQAREEAAFLALADVLVDSVEMDGTSLRDIIGGPENWFMRRNPRNAASIRSLVVMQDAEEQDLPENVNITFQGPSEEELNEWLFDIQQRVMDIAAQVEEVADAFGKDFEKAADAFGEDVENAQRTAENALEDRVGGDVEELAADLGDAVKEMTDSAVVTWSALAAKSQRQQAATSSNAGMYAGVSFGVIGLVAAGAMFAAYKKKQVVVESEEPLL